ncbi:hypothetical protein MiSe_03420 [Microseira wollei NIES-4236]|uniref:Transposase n=1 Tax=Microseira wollei NIES-4236 TaxID=2530354 RepID=A0AAV3X1C8_9CYAN|nr:hypothetical protein MiSe_03420 [Microseira wollei NIES-4236]
MVGKTRPYNIKNDTHPLLPDVMKCPHAKAWGYTNKARRSGLKFLQAALAAFVCLAILKHGATQTKQGVAG